ncbi:hypothetical protein IM532_13530 [Faecalibacter sp. WQ 117]|uniref:Uncharacterized protein n=2 Tax=Faecalibacter rhinopitheci TaxID=2779678 RepID=A0A8J7KIV6_9FLAO|nr:hypothetical protein [Faecalibacter rhinopitheci]
MPDYIVIENDTIPTYNLILEQYLQKKNPNEDKLFGLSFRSSENFGVSTNCWRGYQAIYKIINDKLYLTNIISCGELNSKSRINLEESKKKIKEIFSENSDSNGVFVDWFSGEINFPLKIKNNKQIRWDGVFYRIFEYETVIKFNNGELTNQEKFHNYEIVPNGVNRENKALISDKIFKELKSEIWNKDFDCSEKYLVTIDETGKISKVRMTYTEKELEEYFEKDEYNYCINKIKNALRKMQFDILKDKGKPISEDIYIEIWQEENGKIKNWTK